MSHEGPAAESDGCVVVAESPKIATELFLTVAESTTRDESGVRWAVSRRATVGLELGEGAEIADAVARDPLSGRGLAGIAAAVRIGTGWMVGRVWRRQAVDSSSAAAARVIFVT
jgi:hypothetical protein